jgi:L,D-transpeptidase ErfK/SrfK
MSLRSLSAFLSLTVFTWLTRLRQVLIALGFVVGVVAWLGTGYAYVPLPATEQRGVGAAIQRDGSMAGGMREQLFTENRRLRAKLDRLTPRGVYIVVDQSQNRLYLKQRDRVLLTAVCSSGSGMVLMEEGTKRRWVFDTPRGRFTVSSKLTNPVWRKPDWAFVEDGLPVPQDPAERFEYGSLGEHALYLGDGYMIHGTLYERLLGRSVTHGCIRLGRDDLRAVYRLVPVGTPVFIY